MTILTAEDCTGERHLVIGVSNITALRIEAILNCGATPILISSCGIEFFNSKLKQQVVDDKLVEFHQRDFSDVDLEKLGRQEVDNIVDRVYITQCDNDCPELVQQVYQRCRRLRIPINVVNSPQYSTFTLLSTYRNGDFQLGITTSGKGCRLASRIKRELVNALPSNIDEICNTVGKLRERIQQEDLSSLKKEYQHLIDDQHEEDSIQTLKLNELIHEFEMSESEKKLQRSRWLSQIVEYFPLRKLATLSLDDLSNAYHEYQQQEEEEQQAQAKGSISLIGSGPGAVSLLTVGALTAIYSADLVLADKLVPQQILELIPRATEVFIARKFPGNAEAAQQELLNIGLANLQKGKKIIRLKQGDPYIFGRGGEEFKFFQENGFEPIVIPGITSALAAPVMTQIPVTHREVSDQVLILTGTGRRGVLPDLPEYRKSRTTIFLMALHRIFELIPELCASKGWDIKLPCAIVERASCPDQRVVRTTLEHVAEAYEACGSRPPGLLVTGWACEVLKTQNGKEDEQKWIVEEGCGGFEDHSDMAGLQSILSNLGK